MGFLKSKKFWLTVLHVGLVAGSSYAAYSHGTPLDAVIAGGITSLASGSQSPLFSDGGK